MTDSLAREENEAPQLRLPSVEVDWAPILLDHLTGLYSQVQLAERHNVTVSAVKWRAKKDLWPPRYRSKEVDRPMIIARMFRVLELQVRDLEVEMNEQGGDKKGVGDKEVALLGKLIGNLDKLIAIDGAVGSRKAAPPQNKEMSDIKTKLVERIEQLKRG